MTNPPDTAPVEHETEHYAPNTHDVSQHVRGYLIIGAPLIFVTLLPVCPSSVTFVA